jgi:hypothetical protein
MGQDKLNSDHPLIGVWTEDENSFFRTSVVFTIRLDNGLFCVAGVDESDGVSLQTLEVPTWDGTTLCFVTLFPLTDHKATHEFRAVTEGRAECIVSYSDDEGDHAVIQSWTKVRVN